MEKLAQPLPDGTHTVVALSSHPMHPMLVTFPIALLICALGSDAAFVLLGDSFWARVSLWLLGVGTLMGILAGVAGTVEFLSVAGIRQRAAAWNPLLLAGMPLAGGLINWLRRPAGGAAASFSIGRLV